MIENLNVYAPFPLGIHLTICIIATLFYGYMYARKRYVHYFVLIPAFDLTLLTQMQISKTAFYVVATIELLMIGVIIWSMISVARDKKEKPESVDAPKVENDTDVIDKAFDDDKTE